ITFRPPRSTLFPYTTLFRSSPTKLFLNVFPSNLIKREFLNFLDELKSCIPKQLQVVLEINEAEMIFDFNLLKKRIQALKERGFRSEEHTSELQSRENLVCRL